MTTHDTLMALVSDYVSEYPNDTCGAAQKAALSAAIAEVLAERDALRAELDTPIRRNLLHRIAELEAELALRTAEVDSLNIDKGHMRAEVERLKAIENGLSTCKRMREAPTAEDWKRIAEHLEWQWSSCSTFANKVAGERDTALAELARLKSITQFKCGVDYADNSLTVTVARLAHDGVVEIIHCEQIDLASGAAQGLAEESNIRTPDDWPKGGLASGAAPKLRSAFEEEAALVAQSKAFMGSR